MRVRFRFGYGQVLLGLVFAVSVFSGCRRTSDELPVVPPATFPLSREYIGYGVVNVSFTHLLTEPRPGGTSESYLRRGTVLRIIERRLVLDRGNSESWVLTEGNSPETGSAFNGWLEETTLDIYDNESRAKTASKAMSL